MIFIDMMVDIKTKMMTYLFEKGRLKPFCLMDWWIDKYNLHELYSEIKNHTKFLDRYNPSMRERIFYIQMEFTSPQLCPHCNTASLIFKKNTLSLSKHCGSRSCKSIHTSIMAKLIYSSMSNEQKSKVTNNFKIAGNLYGKSVKGKRLEDIHGEEKAKEIKKKISSSEVYKREDVKQKRTDSRRRNNVVWHTDETKLKIQTSNKRTFNSEQHKTKHALTYKNVSEKLSKIMKDKILNGKFTPHITNSWTRWKAFVSINGNIKHFRSNWEAVFWLLNPHLLYENTRIKYILNGDEKIYITDFTDIENKIIYEIKPKSEKNKIKNKKKLEALVDWCSLNNYTFRIISDDWFVENAKKINFNEHKNLYKSMKQFI